ncbi:hypothetical protein DIPPA_33561 [Diplonema papillatum]|nr:hypothetical protein DIPPA_33561 [Diplonema papillatum]
MAFVFKRLFGSSRARDEQITDVLAKFAGSEKRQTGILVPFVLSGIGQVSFDILLPNDFPTSSAKVRFYGQSNVCHPSVDEQSMIREEALVRASSQTRDLASVVTYLMEDMIVRPPTVHLPGEEPVVVTKAADEAMGCSFQKGTYVLESVDASPTCPARKCGLDRFIGRVLLKVNNSSVQSTDLTSSLTHRLYIVLTFEAADGAGDDPATDLPDLPDIRSSAVPGREFPALPNLQSSLVPDVPGDFGLDALSAEQLARMADVSRNPTALDDYFRKLPFTATCAAAVAERKTLLGRLEARRAEALGQQDEAATKLAIAKAQQDSAANDLVAIKAQVETITEQLSKPSILSKLDKELREIQSKTDTLEYVMCNTPLDDAKILEYEEEFRRGRVQYHQIDLKRKALLAS